LGVEVDVVDVRSSVLRESSGAEGGARIPANVRWTKRLRGSLAAMRLCDRCPVAVFEIRVGGSFGREAGQDAGPQHGLGW
jgi:hypothetical protein